MPEPWSFMVARMDIEVARSDELSVVDYQSILRASGLAERRPVDDMARLARMLGNSNLVVTAREAQTGRIVGVARSITDFSYCCYLADLAVDREYQGQGIGRRLAAKTRELAGSGTAVVLLSAPDSLGFYASLGFSQPTNAFLCKRAK